MDKKDIKGRVLKEGEDQLKDGRYRYRFTDKYGKEKPYIRGNLYQ